jgi:hypothetical protein
VACTPAAQVALERAAADEGRERLLFQQRGAAVGERLGARDVEEYQRATARRIPLVALRRAGGGCR